MGRTVKGRTQGSFEGWRTAPGLCGLLLIFLCLSIPAVADSPPHLDTAERQATTPTPSSDEVPEDNPQDAGPPDDCDSAAVEMEFQEKAQDTLRSWSCYTFRWFDSWWGNEYDFEEKEVNGWMLAGAEYREYEGFDPRLRLKVRAPLPNMSQRWDVLLGRLDEESYVTDTDLRDSQFYNSGLVDRGEEDSWLLGLGHRRNRGKRTGWNWSVGVRLRVPPEPYVKTSWTYRKRFTPETDLRFRQTFFWRSNKNGFGTTSRADLTKRLNARDVLRLEGIARITENTQGTDWYIGHTWYHLLPSGTALSFLTFLDGETNRPVKRKDGGFQLIWRRPFTRDWIYLSWGPSLTWPRRNPEDERETNLGFGVWLEMEFGDWRY